MRKVGLLLVLVGFLAACSVQPQGESDMNFSDSKVTLQGTTPSVRTVVYMYKETVSGQDIFIKGGHDADLVSQGYYPSMDEPITYNNTLNATTASIKAADDSLDWFTESALDWTTSSWPASWGTKRTYAIDGYGEDPENDMGSHWWKFDVMMTGNVGDWFEFKAFMRQNGVESWENNINQQGTPQQTINHWGKKGYITIVTFGQSGVEFRDLGPVNTAPVAALSQSSSSVTVNQSVSFDASASLDAEDGSNLEYRFDYDNDGTFDTAWSSSAVASTSYSSDGNYTVVVEVRDTKGATDTASVQLEVLPAGHVFTGKLGTTLYSDGSVFSIWWRSAVVQNVRVRINSQDYPMTYINGGDNDGVWWVFVEGAKAGDEYQFVGNKSGVETVVADPYSQYNRYSGGKSVVVDHSTFQWTDQSWSRPTWDNYMIYELHVKDFTSGDTSIIAAHRGKYLGVADKMQYLQNLGITAIHVMPPSEFSDAGYSWGYNTSLFQAVESGFATDPTSGQLGVDEFKAMVNAAHNYGIAVVVDMVFNHTANNDNWLWVIDNEAYFSGSTPWGNRLNTAHPIVHRYANDTLEMYMTKYHVDGFRFDATGNGWLDHGLLKDAKSYCSSIDPNVYFVYEQLPNDSDLKTWGAQWADGYHDTGINAICGWDGANAQSMMSRIYYNKDDGWAASPVESLNYFESHDEDTLAYLMNVNGWDEGKKKARTRLAAVTLVGSLGNPMIWMGQEFLRSREGQDTAEHPLEWNVYQANQDVYNYYGGVFRLRRDNPALHSADESKFAWIYSDPSLLAWRRMAPNTGDKEFVVAVNYDQWNTKSFTLPAGNWKEVATEASIYSEFSAPVKSGTVTVGANSGVIFMR